MKISSQFDSGNIVVKTAENPLDIQLEIQKESSIGFFPVVSLSFRNTTRSTS